MKNRRSVAIMLVFSMMLSLMPLPVLAEEEQAVIQADSGSFNDILSWSLSDDGLLTISGSGDMPNYNNAESVPWYRQRSMISRVIVGSGVKSIGNNVFAGLASMVSVSLPGSVDKIGNYAFDGCSSLLNITISNSVTGIGSYAFRNCDALQSVTIPGSIATIGDHAFYDDNSLRSVTILSGCVTIGSWAYEKCNRLQEITIPTSVTAVNSGAFYDCSRLVDVYYTGNAVQWNVISIGSSNDALTGAKRYYNAAADSTKVDGPVNVEWEVADGVLTISGTGNMTEYSSAGSAPWYSQRMNISSLVVSPGITGISDYAFAGLTVLQSADIADTVTSIGYAAFQGCSALPAVVIPDSVTWIGDYAFQNCSSLADVRLPRNLRYIRSYTFDGCASLINVNIPEGTAWIGSYAFQNCDALQSVTIPGSITTIVHHAFYDDNSLRSVTILGGCTVIGERAFYNCNRLQEITIPATVTAVNSNAFSNCSRLVDVYYTGNEAQWNAITINGGNDALTGAKRYYNAADDSTVVDDPVRLAWEVTQDGTLIISGTGNMTEYSSAGSAPWYSQRMNIFKLDVRSGITGISDYAFAGLSVLESVSIADSVMSIGYAAFQGCTALSSVVIPDSVTQIWGYSFQNCTSLTYVRLSQNLRSIRGYNFDGCTSLLNITIPDSVTGLGSYAFQNCDALQSVTIPGSIATIENYAFNDDNSLRSVTILGGCTTIGSYAYRNCNMLQEITVPASLITVNGYAFQYCSSLRRVYYTGRETQWNAISINSSGNNTFTGAEKTFEFTAAPESVTLDAESAVVNVGATFVLAPLFTPENTTQRSVYWSSSDESVAAVSGGIVTGVSEGSATVTATTADGKCAAVCEVTVRPSELKLVRIELKGPDKTTYVEGTPLDAKGLVVTAVHSDGVRKTRAAVTDYTISGYDNSRVGASQTVKVTYADETGSASADFTVRVEAKRLSGLRIKRKPDKLLYRFGEGFDRSGLIVEAVYNNGEVIAVNGSECEIKGYNSGIAGEQLVVVSYSGFTAVFSVTVLEPGTSAGLVKPVISIKSLTGGKEVTLTTSTEGASIYYTDDGTTIPDEGVGTLYNSGSPIRLDTKTDKTIKAVAVKDGKKSDVTTGKISVYQTGAPKIYPGEGAVQVGTIVTAKSDTAGSTIYYTTNGNAPSVPSAGDENIPEGTYKYSGAVVITQDIVKNGTAALQFVAVKDGYASSEVTRAVYNVSDPGGGTTGGEDVTVTLGSVEAAAGDAVSVPVYVVADDGNARIKSLRIAFSFDDDMFDSTFTVTPGERLNASQLFWSADKGDVNIMFVPGANDSYIDCGEICTLNLLSLASMAGRSCNVAVNTDNTEITLDSADNTDIAKIDGVISLTAARISQASTVVGITTSDGETITSDNTGKGVGSIESGSVIEANITVDDEKAELSELPGGSASVFLAIYDPRGHMVKVDNWEVDIADPSFALIKSIRVPENVRVGKLKIMVMNDSMVPILALNELS